MHILDKLFTRRRHRPRFADLPPRLRQRVAIACQELSEEEEAIAARLGLAYPPRLLMVDEEEAVILTPSDRAKIR